MAGGGGGTGFAGVGAAMRRYLEELAHDLRGAARTLLRTPGFTVTAVLTLALGIGATTTMFTVVDGVLLRPLPYPEASRLVVLGEVRRGVTSGLSHPDFVDWKGQQELFEQMGVFRRCGGPLMVGGTPLAIACNDVSAEVFAALRVAPALGRLLGPEDDRPGAPRVAVLSHSFWQEKLGGDPGIVGQALGGSGVQRIVVGVMPAGFTFGGADVAMWTPAGPAAVRWRNRGDRGSMFALARMKPGITLARVTRDLEAVAARLEREYPQTNRDVRPHVETLLDSQVRGVRRTLWVLFGAAALVLLIACSNVASLLLTRALAREKEMAVRVALGAGPGRIVRQVLTESVLLASVGGLAGVLLASWTFQVFRAVVGARIPRLPNLSVDARVVAFAVATAVVTGIVFGLAPALQARRKDLQQAMRSDTPARPDRVRLRQGLIVGQMALTLMLLVGAGLLFKTLNRLVHTELGFSAEQLLTFELGLLERKHPNIDQQIRMSERWIEQIRALPGVTSASLASQVPLDDVHGDAPFLVEGQAEVPPEQRPRVQMFFVDPGYFRTVGIPLLRGRPFTPQDDQSHLGGTDTLSQRDAAANVVILDNVSARRLWPAGDPIGRRLRVTFARDRYRTVTVVGVVGRVKLDHLRESDAITQAYFPFRQSWHLRSVALVRSALPPSALLPAVRRLTAEADPESPVTGVNTLGQIRSDQFAPERLNFLLVGAFAAVGLLLALVGLYGLLAYWVAQRRREIGIRMALGAGRAQIVTMVMNNGLRLALVGVAIGLLGALALTRVLAALLYEVTPDDPGTFLAVSALLLAVSLLASYLPSRRAARLDAAGVIRQD